MSSLLLAVAVVATYLALALLNDALRAGQRPTLANSAERLARRSRGAR